MRTVIRGDEVEQLYVDAAARGSGVAGALLEHAEHEIAAGHPVAWLAVAEGDARGRRFYARSGWSNAGAFDYAGRGGGGHDGRAVPALRAATVELTRL